MDERISDVGRVVRLQGAIHMPESGSGCSYVDVPTSSGGPTIARPKFGTTSIIFSLICGSLSPYMGVNSICIEPELDEAEDGVEESLS
jgi:hypothetical protein